MATEQLKIRIRAHDSFNWVVEYFVPGGAVIRGSRRHGELSKERWERTGYFASLETAATIGADQVARVLALREDQEPLASFRAACSQILAALHEHRRVVEEALAS